MCLTKNLCGAYCLLLLSAMASPAFASVDLSQIDRTIGKLPELRSAQPEYCLLVFGPEAAKRVWLIHDGDVLYVDRNCNGDLTEPREAVKVTNESPASDKFKVGSITDGQLEHKELVVYWMNAEHLRDRDSRVKVLLDENPKWRMCNINIDVEIPGQKGAGRGGRVPQSVSYQDTRGIFQFAIDPKAAPIVHFGGPWEITFYSKEDWHVDQTEQPTLSVGTLGLGPGTTAYVEYQDVIPAELKPELLVTFPQLDDARAAVTKSYQLGRRCCGINLYGDIRVPTDVGPGTATVEISIPNWPGTTVASTTHEVKILPAPARPKLKPVSKRLIGALEHVNKPLHALEARLIDIQFSPDGKRLVAGEVPSGVVQLWDVDARKSLRTFDTGVRHRFSQNFFAVSLNWQTLSAATFRNNQRIAKVEQDGKTLSQFTFDDSIREWNIESGALVRSLRHSPPRRIDELHVSADGRWLLSHEAVPGAYESSYPLAMTLWNVADGAYRTLPGGIQNYSVISRDGKYLAATLCPNRLVGYSKAIKIFDCASLAETATITLPEGKFLVRPQAFDDDNSILVVCLQNYTAKDDGRHCTSFVKFWETKTGNEIASIPVPDEDVWLTACAVSR